MDDISLATAIFSIVCSIIASWLFLKYQKISEYRVKKKVADLDFEIEFLDRIGNGYKELIRVSVKVLCFSLGLCATAAAILVAAYFVNFLAPFKSVAVIIALSCLISAAGIFFVHFRSLVQLIDKESVQNKMREKKEKLESKLESR